MKSYPVEQLRNIALLAHSSAGKTSLSEAFLYDSGATTRLGRVEEGNTVSDYDPEEQRRNISVSTSVLPCEWKDHKLNILDTPGYMDFVGEMKGAVRVADSVIVLVCAASGVEVGTELVWAYADEQELPRLVFINKMDRDNANFDQALDHLREKFEAKFVPLQIPIGSQATFEGVVDLVSMKAYLGPEAVEADVPADVQDRAESLRMELVETVAETDDELVMKYLEGEELTLDEIQDALAKSTETGALVPVLCGSATVNVGVTRLMDAALTLLPSPAYRSVKAQVLATGEEKVLSPETTSPLAALVFKTFADPFVGKLTYFRVYSGSMPSDSRVFNPERRAEERIGQLFYLRGKEQVPTNVVGPGDIGAVPKLQETKTGDVLCDKGFPLALPGISYPHPVYSVAIEPRTKTDLDKLGPALNRLVEEDPTLRVSREPDTGEMILSGMGDSHIDIANRRLQQKFGVQIDTKIPRVPYKETITRVASAQGRHKKQTGGRGQFGDIFLRLEPLEVGSGFEFDSEIFGGSVPRQYIPAVEKGLRETIQSGILAGFPVVDVRAVLYDGSYHTVDSSEIAFKLAARLGFRNAMADAGPVLLEPVMDITVTVPEQYMGDILGDFNTRRGKVLGMSQSRGNAVVSTQVPLAEMRSYATDLRSMTQGRGIFTMEFSHYERVPAYMAEKVIEEAKQEAEES